MASVWIKVDHATVDKPEIVEISGILNIDHDAVVGKCIRFWIWADQQTQDGCALSVTKAFVDRLVFCPGFAKALCKVGWLNGRDGHYSIPNFADHNGQSAKKRAQSQKRMQKIRDGSVARKAQPEKRREEEKSSNKESGSELFVPPSAAEVQSYVDEYHQMDPHWPTCELTGEDFCDHYAAQDWLGGNGIPIADWKAKVRQWGKRAPKQGREKKVKKTRFEQSMENEW